MSEQRDSPSANRGTVTSVRGSVVDVHFPQMRQQSITEELLDVVAGFTVLTDKEHAISRAQE